MDEIPPRSVNQVVIDTRGKNSRTPEPCMLYNKGLCSLGQNCNFIHVEGQRRNVDSCEPASSGFGLLGKRKSCFDLLYKGRCTYGAKCKYAHNIVGNELPDQSRVRYDVSSDSRSQSATVDLRGPYQNSSNQCHGQFGRKGDWKTKICTIWQLTRNCPYGSSCTYAHGEKELRGQSGAQYELISNSGTESATVPPHRPYGGTANLSASDQVIPNIGTQSATADPREANHGTENESSRGHSNAKHPFNWNRKTNCIYADWVDDVTQFYKKED